jgi:hypothetical protein
VANRTACCDWRIAISASADYPAVSWLRCYSGLVTNFDIGGLTAPSDIPRAWGLLFATMHYFSTTSVQQLGCGRSAPLRDLHDLDQRLSRGRGGELASSASRHRENAMGPLIAVVFSVAALLSAISGAFAQGAEPGSSPTVSPSVTPGPSPTPSPSSTPNPSPTPSPGPSPQSSSTYNTPPIKETGRYHPCPASVGLPNGRTVCLGLDQPARHVARRPRCRGWCSYWY